MWKNIQIILITALVTSSLTFGFTSFLLTDQVHANVRETQYLRQDNESIKESIVNANRDFSQRQDSIAKLVQENLKQSTELIQLLKLQQQFTKP